MIYDRKCLDCDTIFEVSCKMAEKETKEFQCPNCTSKSGAFIPVSPTFLDARGITDRHPAEKTGFDRVLKDIDARMGTKSFNP